MAAEFERQKQRVWANLKKEFDYYPPQGLIEWIDEYAGPIEEERDLVDYRAIAGQYMKIAKEAASASYFTRPKVSKTPPKKRYQRSLKRRLYLVEFVISRQLTLRKQRGRIRKRINWEDTCRAWNETHPNDPMTLEVLKTAFYRAIADQDLQLEFIKGKNRTIGEALWNGRLHGVIEPDDLASDWAFLFAIWEMIHKGRGEPFDSRELELEMIRDPQAARNTQREIAVWRIAERYDADPVKLKDLGVSIEETESIAKSGKYKKEVRNETI